MRTFLLLVLMTLCLGCKSKPPRPSVAAQSPLPAAVAQAPVAVVINPSAVTVPAGRTVTFAATVTGGTNLAVAWAIEEGASCGWVATSGLYTAPNSATTCRVVATANADPTKTAIAAVTVTAPPPLPVPVSISPTTATVDACNGLVLTATATNGTSTAVTWTVAEAGGGAVTNGIYTAPSVAGTYHVVATSVVDATQGAQATISVRPERVHSLALWPGNARVLVNGRLTFKALVTTSCGTFAPY
jgi:hypothetical protein